MKYLPYLGIFALFCAWSYLCISLGGVQESRKYHQISAHTWEANGSTYTISNVKSCPPRKEVRIVDYAEQ